jgi:Tol biopolymer transport system component
MARMICALVAVAIALPGAGTSAQARGSDAAPQVSPDGRYLLYRRVYPSSRYTPAPQELRVASSDGSGERVVVGITEHRFGASWGPGGFISVTRDGRTELIRPEDGSVVRTAAIPEDPAWSPDGRLAAYSTGRALRLANADGSGTRVVVTSHRLGWVRVGEWSPDSTRVTYAKDLPRPNRVASEIVRADEAVVRRLKVAPVVGAASWAPSGRLLAMVAQGDLRRPNRYRPPQLYIARADGSRMRRLVRGFAGDPAWSPTGQQIAYVRQIPGRGNNVDRWDLMLVRPAGSAPRRIVRVDYGASPAWFPDGRHLAISGQGRCRVTGIYRVDVVRRTVTRLTNRC